MESGQRKQHSYMGGDKWLPSSTTYKVASPRQFIHNDIRVSELID